MAIGAWLTLKEFCAARTACSRAGRRAMAQIRFTGLKSGLPIGFMAALGAFRQAAHMSELGTVELAWAPRAGQWCAVLHMSEPVEPEMFVRLLLDRVKASGDRPEFQWSEAIKTRSREEFAKGARPAIEAASAAD